MKMSIELVSAAKIYQAGIIALEGDICSLAFAPDDRFFCAGCNNGLLFFIDSVSHQIYRQAVLEIRSNGYSSSHTITSLAFAQRKEVILTAGRLGVVIVNYEGVQICEYPLQGWLSPVIKLSNNEKLFAVSDDDRVIVIHLGDMEKIVEFKTGKYCVGVEFSKDDKYLYAGGKEGKMIQKWNLENGLLESEWDAHTGIILQLAINKDGTQLISSGEDFVLKRWDLTTESELPVSGLANGKENCIKFSHDYSLLGTASLSRMIALRHPESLEIIWHDRFENYVTALDFSKNDRCLIAGDDRGKLKIWNIGDHTGIQ